MLISCNNVHLEHKIFNDYPTTNSNLWLEYSKNTSTFKIWSPTANAVKLNLYKNGSGGELLASHKMTFDKNGIWKIKLDGDLKNIYYTYQVKINNTYLNETPGIYAQAVGVNGLRAMVVDLNSTNPEGWEKDNGPKVNTPNDAVIYEAHIRDLSIHPESGITNKGKFLGLAETSTISTKGLSTGLDHIKDMGITHIHLLPTYDFISVDESQTETAQYNWGYDPANYNVPEGSYATDAHKGEIRIREFKKMVKAIHDEDMGIILDVVFNHTATYNNAAFNLEIPAYYYRHLDDGTPSNASACGNEIASEREMMRKFVIESVSYWAKEYHVDGFRFDLMGILDIETMNQVSKTLKAINPNIIIYGEAWASGDSPYPIEKRALKININQLNDVAAFSDEIRDGLKGSWNEYEVPGFVNGALGMEASVQMGIVGCIEHPQINYNYVNTSKAPWANQPWQSVLYVSCHDNHTLYDKLKITRPEATEATIVAMHKLANAVVLTSQGIPLIHAGAEMLRTKQGVENSYNFPDSINHIDWDLKSKNLEVFNYYKNLIKLRKEHPAFRMKSAEDVRKNLVFKTYNNGLISYQIRNNANGDSWKNIYIIYNAKPKKTPYIFNEIWKLAVFNDSFNNSKPIEGIVEIPALSMFIAYQD